MRHIQKSDTGNNTVHTEVISPISTSNTSFREWLHQAFVLALWLGEKITCFPFEWCPQRVGSWEKGRAAYSAGKNERCPVLGLPVGDYTYMAGGAQLLCLFAGTELATQRNPVPEQRSGGIIISVFIGVPFYFKKWRDALVPQLCSLPPF